MLKKNLLFLSILLPILLALGAQSQRNGDKTKWEVNVQLQEDSVLHVWMRAMDANQDASIQVEWYRLNALGILKLIQTSTLKRTSERDFFEFVEVKLRRQGHFKLIWHTDKTEVAYIYAYEPRKVKREGIRQVYIRPKARHNPLLMANSYHLRTPLGWANEPNGFSRSNDKIYHVFYQHVITENRRFKNLEDSIEGMHWGHAISRDLVNWVHLPVFLLSRFEKRPENPVYKWVHHWFSGSAVPEGRSGLRIFVTNFNMGRPDLGQQVQLVTRDGILPSPGKEKVVIKTFPEKPVYNGMELKVKRVNFRDPGVLKGPGGFYYMTLGTEDVEKGGAILLYRTKEPNNLDSEWVYESVLIVDSRDDFGNIECPGLIPLGDANDPATLYVLMYGREKGHEDNIHRLRDTLMALGRFDGNKFVQIAEQTLDFAFGSYGHQGFYDPIDRQALTMGWNSWWNDWDFASDFFSSQSLPRVLKAAPDEKHILVGLHPNVLSKLRGQKLLDRKGNNPLTAGAAVKVPNGMAYIRLAVKQPNNAEIYLEIKHPAYKELSTRVGPDGLELVKDLRVQEGPKDTRRLIAAGAKPDIVHVFIDRDSLEIYGEQLADGGMPRWLGTTRLTGNGKHCVESVQLSKGIQSIKVEGSGIWKMKKPSMLGAMQVADVGAKKVMNTKSDAASGQKKKE